MSRIIGPIGSIALLLAAVSCTSEPTGPGPADRGSALVEAFVQPTQVTLPAGTGLYLRVVLRGVDDTPLGQIGADIDWMSSDDNVVTVSRSGFIEARRLGTATISATVTAPCGTHVVVAYVQVVSGVEAIPSPTT